MSKGRLSSEEATTVVAQGVYDIFGDDGPAPAAADFFAVRKEEANRPEQYNSVQDIPLKGFAGQDCDAVKPQIDPLWGGIVARLKEGWARKFVGAPFPATEPQRPDPYDCDTTVGDIVTQIIIWGKKV